jgi:ribonuclease BN (tRNA processing enzyme)
MKLRVLGCSGGIGGRLRTTSLLIDSDLLIDAGTGIEDLTIEELAGIDRVFITHSHLDHIACLPMLIDTVGHLRNRPLVVHALPDTIAALKAHIFNWVIWPDFSEIPHYKNPYMVFEPLAVGASAQVGDRLVKCIPANHTVPAVGFQVTNANGSLVFSGDTTPNEAFWQTINSISDLRYLIIETAFSNREQDLATLAKHLYPIQLGRELKNLRVEAEIYITHLKPADAELIAREVEHWAGRYTPKILEQGMIIEL